MTAVVRHSPSHFPELAEKLRPRGWSVFRVGNEVPYAHAVLCAPLPVKCAERCGFSEHVSATPASAAAVLEHAASAIERHAETCPECTVVLECAVRRAARM